MREVIEQCAKALEQDPLNVSVRSSFAFLLSLGKAYDRGLAEAQKAMKMDASHWLPHFAIGLSYALRGEFAAARPAAERSVRAAPWWAQALGLLAGVLAQLGETERADELVTRLTDMRPAGLPIHHFLCSGNDAAADWLAQMIEDRDPMAPAWSCLKPIRASPLWPALAKMISCHLRR